MYKILTLLVSWLLDRGDFTFVSLSKLSGISLGYVVRKYDPFSTLCFNQPT